MLNVEPWPVQAAAHETFRSDDLRKKGLQVVRNFFEPDILESLLSFGRFISEEVRAGRYARSNQHISNVEIAEKIPLADSIKLRAVAEEICGKDACRLVTRILMKDKNFGGAIQAHQDWPYYGGDTRKLSVFVPLTRCSADNGMLIFYEGSHALGPVERGTIDIDRYPEFTPVCPELDVGDVLFADFLTWHSSASAVCDDERILVQLVLQPGSDRSSNNLFDGIWRRLGPLVPSRTSAMLNAVPSIGVAPARQLISLGVFDEAERMARGLAIDSPFNVEAQLLLGELAARRGEDGAPFVAAAETALAELGARVAQAKGESSAREHPEQTLGELERLKCELAAIRSSTSWRMTAPLRWLGGAVKGQ